MLHRASYMDGFFGVTKAMENGYLKAVECEGVESIHLVQVGTSGRLL
jgi:hypothetical protein